MTSICHTFKAHFNKIERHMKAQGKVGPLPEETLPLSEDGQRGITIRVGHIRRFAHVAPQNPLMLNPVKVCYSTFLFEGP